MTVFPPSNPFGNLTRVFIGLVVFAGSFGCSLIYDTDDYRFETDTDSDDTEIPETDSDDTEIPETDTDDTGDTIDKAHVCSAYCTTIDEACTDQQKQYSTTQGCLDTCMALPLGNNNDEIGNTIGCRMHYAIEAVEDNSFCLAAGPLGNGICGSNCEGFCQIEDNVCLDDHDQYATITDCISECTKWDTSVPFKEGILKGDTQACRMTHLTLAATTPSIHCRHIGTASPVCQ